LATPPVEPASATALDHVAVAVERWSDAWPRYVGELGGTWHSGGVNSGFSPAQLSFANGARVEILQPWHPEENPFLRRFIDHNGPGPHHLTFKVPDIEASLARVDDAGFEPVGVRLSDPQWQEAFLHPRQATGVVVQLAHALVDWTSPAPEGFPTRDERPVASLSHVTHVVPDLEIGLELFHHLLDGHVRARGTATDGTWTYADLSWRGPLALRLVAPVPGGGAGSSVGTWLGGRPGRVHHLAFTWNGAAPTSGVAASPATPGVVPGRGRPWMVAPADNVGTGLIVTTEGATDDRTPEFPEHGAPGRVDAH
jgi:catechol 2,3-dioxygenase-like lactoylglutathione lyase family enzyme